MKNTPRDFFVHIGAFGTLYFAAIALITLLFRMVDFIVPDPLLGSYYSDPYSGPMRFAIASLIILVPLFLYLMRLIQNETRATPARQEMGIRRWLTYITLFIAGATIIGDLIILLNSFLGGTLPTPFLLKSAILITIMGTGFWYFILDISGYWLKRSALSKGIGYGTGVLVAIIIVSGFFIMGSPATQRAIRLDVQTVQDLSSVQYQIVDYWQQNGRLPATLDELGNDITGYRVPVAPDGRSSYEYVVKSNLSFALCATFAEDTATTNYVASESMYGVRGVSNWSHTAGPVCFDRSIDTNLTKPVQVR